MQSSQLPVQISVFAGVAFGLGLLLLALKPKERAGVRNNLAALLFLFLLLLAALGLQHWGAPSVWVRSSSGWPGFWCFV